MTPVGAQGGEHSGVLPAFWVWSTQRTAALEEFAARACPVQFLERPVEDTAHDQLALQIRDAVAAYERSPVTERLRRGQCAKLESGQLLPWSRPVYVYLLDPDHPPDPRSVQVHPAADRAVRRPGERQERSGLQI